MTEFLKGGIEPKPGNIHDAIYIAETDEDVKPNPTTVEGDAITLFHGQRLTGRYAGRETFMASDPANLAEAIESIAEAGAAEIRCAGSDADRWSALSREGILFMGRLDDGSFDA